jgi:hypothetical protein
MRARHCIIAACARRTLPWVAVLWLCGCATYSYKFQPIEHALAARQPDKALAVFEKIYSPTGVDAPLYYLNKGMLLRLAGRYEQSNAALEQAKKLIEKVEAISISEQAGSFIVSDTVRSYEGEDFEKVLLHLYKALNYLDLNQPYEARVEALQVDIRVRELSSGASAATLTEEAFARYLAGIIYEGLGEWNDAMVSYRKAYEAFKEYGRKYGVPFPPSLKVALLRLAQRQGLEDELRVYRDEFGIGEWQSVAEREANGELVVTLHEGLVALKGEQSSAAIDPQSGRMIRISLPYYRARPSVVTQARLLVAGQSVPLELVEDVNALAVKSLQSHMAAITARAIARAAVKYRAAKQAGERDPALGLLMNVAGVVTETADTRSWSTLPAHIYLARVSLPPGRHDAKLELLDGSARLIYAHDLGGVLVAQGKSEYRSVHWTSRY